MPTLITPFPPSSHDGGGWVTRQLIEKHKYEKISYRKNNTIKKIYYAALGCITLPFIHPIFTRFLPLWQTRNKITNTHLNFSQTFGMVFFRKNCTLICHDLQYHRSFMLKCWARWSEKLLLSHAKKILVLSERDKKIVTRYYKIPIKFIENIGPFLTQEIESFTSVTPPNSKRIVFLGSLSRPENLEGIKWFVKNVLPSCPDIEVHIIGALYANHGIAHPQIKHLGFVDNLEEFLSSTDLMIAPMLSGAGIKIKVIESLKSKTPVLGTKSAYSGLPKPSAAFISDNNEHWIKTLNDGGIFVFPHKR
ncbi:glycosyltransferase [Pseudogulbenkiania sp. NH8B]|uniref:glycosyltransferase n=1 Tax=Pseudogulbenkiania sp. (strain NH8B) TaxID=748280 RepID=UPI00130DB987|nr:glycosyltransferase family 4 protein [Pseudogulbenkiania sp. NH8B]